MDQEIHRIRSDIEQILGQVLADWAQTLSIPGDDIPPEFSDLACELSVARHAMIKATKLIEQEVFEADIEVEDPDDEVLRTIKIDVEEKDVKRKRPTKGRKK
ncbi:hypothetical protein [uncultured Ruegeria sp.]|jgi:hypothetical protein|uniref:hypothetical protein n=1 Tax=uncultured Ruegeria sp. TaxID=259304 RepID=UPI0026238C9B|nr:hypothetical protein [uncultured Ruegeria sp.]